MIDFPKKIKVKLATFLLQDSIEDWWILYMARVGRVSFVTWEKFRKEFKDKFYPRSFCDAKRKEFMNLVQGDMTDAKYEKRFTELVKYALAFVIDEADKFKWFEEAL